MIWLQENYIIAVVGLVVAVFLLWWFFGRSKPQDIAPPIEPAKPAKPLAPVKPEIIAAEPARFKPVEPKPQPAAAAPPPPAPAPLAKAAPPAAEPAPAVQPAADAATPAPKPAAKPKAAAKPAAKKAAPKEPVAKPATKPTAKPAAKKAVAKPAPVPAPASAPRQADNLQLLKGIGPKLAALLGGLGVTSFAQIAAWTDADVAAIDPQLGAFQGRIARDNIVDQAGYLARGDKAGFEAKYGALGSEI